MNAKKSGVFLILDFKKMKKNLHYLLNSDFINSTKCRLELLTHPFLWQMQHCFKDECLIPHWCSKMISINTEHNNFKVMPMHLLCKYISLYQPTGEQDTIPVWRIESLKFFLGFIGLSTKKWYPDEHFDY